MKEYYAAIDLGAESGRVILGVLDLDNKKMEYDVIHRFPTKGTYVFETYRWNLLRFWEEIKIGLKKISNMEGIQLKGIGVDSWGVNLVFLTKDNEFACQPFHYRDDLIETGDKVMRETFNMEEVYEITGIMEMTLNGLPHLAGMHKKYPDILKRTEKIMMIPDYFNYLLTGIFTTEYSEATTTQLFDANKMEWSAKLLEPWGLKPSIFPKLLHPGHLVGNLNSFVQEEVGLGDIPVYTVASHDTGSAVVGVPADAKDNNWGYLSSGTWSLLGLEVSKPLINKKIKDFNMTNEGGAFKTIRLLKVIMGLFPIQRCKEIWDVEAEKEGIELTYEIILKEAMLEEPNRSIIDLEDPSFMNPKNMIEAIKQNCGKNNQPIPDTRARLARCIYDSLVKKYKDTIEKLEELTDIKIDRLHIVGGGSQADLFNQLIADNLGIEVFSGPVEATAVGNIMVQAYANGSV
ncbi:MAG: rhamnulokinase, partial [archaeon]|nr:rhamnulokinase [archaeon]